MKLGAFNLAKPNKDKIKKNYLIGQTTIFINKTRTFRMLHMLETLVFKSFCTYTSFHQYHHHVLLVFDYNKQRSATDSAFI